MYVEYSRGTLRRGAGHLLIDVGLVNVVDDSVTELGHDLEYLRLPSVQGQRPHLAVVHAQAAVHPGTRCGTVNTAHLTPLQIC
jgi:hypothetical protein